MPRKAASSRCASLTGLAVLCAMLPWTAAMAVEGLPEAKAIAKRLEAEGEPAR